LAQVMGFTVGTQPRPDPSLQLAFHRRGACGVAT
jgi:hypothetical protein